MSDAKHWKQEFSDSKSRSRFWLSLVIGWTVGALLIALSLGLYEKKPSEPTPDIANAKTIFVVVNSPSTQLLDQLRDAYENGAHIQMVTTDSIETPYKISVVSKEKITQNAILLNGSQWYPIP